MESSAPNSVRPLRDLLRLISPLSLARMAEAAEDAAVAGERTVDDPTAIVWSELRTMLTDRLQGLQAELATTQDNIAAIQVAQAAAAAAAAAAPAGLQLAGVPAGAIVAYAGAVAPQDWLLLDGSRICFDDHPDLCRVLGATWGPITMNDQGKFMHQLPDFRSSTCIGVREDCRRGRWLRGRYHSSGSV